MFIEGCRNSRREKPAKGKDQKGHYHIQGKLNRDIGQKLPPAMLQLVSQKADHVTRLKIGPPKEGCVMKPKYTGNKNTFLRDKFTKSHGIVLMEMAC